MPYMERNCHLSFIRENMLLATVLDRFCIDNTTRMCGSDIAYGKFMGAYTFFFQDFPQFSIHLYFLFAMHDPDSNVLHGNYIVKLSLVISFFAFCISSFNFAMFKQNKFDPILIERALWERRERKRFREEIEKGTKHEAKIGSQKDKFKRRMTSVVKVEGLALTPTEKKALEIKRKSSPSPNHVSLKRKT